ncbi:MAG TPA: aminotransferase class V-fold PLP-dependent enzyme [Acidimicrobiales bacterium]|nr:aminotransferase class V-fold PLP-dependent enzyme [Acidimicrobiales bacterium]
MTMIDFPVQRSSVANVMERLEQMSAGDLDWKSGRVFSLVYSAGDEVDGLAERVYSRFSHENALNVDAFPSLRAMQRDLISASASMLGSSQAAPIAPWLSSGDGAQPVNGFLTSGGTESLLMAVLVARDFAALRGIKEPTMILPASAHAAFEKAAHYFGVQSIRIPVDADWRVDVSATMDAIDANTSLVVGSAMSYPQGVIDPIEELGELCLRYEIPFHVDACMGGFILPFLTDLGHVSKPFDFRVPGVTSISADLHKYGYAPKGISVILYRAKALRSLQPFVTTNWLGGIYGSPSMAGTRAAAPIAAAWAVMNHLGREGYQELAGRAWVAARKAISGIGAIDTLKILGDPDATVFAFAAKDESESEIFRIGDQIAAKGWHLDRQSPPDSLHATVHAGHIDSVSQLVTDIEYASRSIEHDENPDSASTRQSTVYGTVE